MTTKEFKDAVDQSMSEDDHQIRLFEEMEPYCIQYPELKYMHHIPNGGYRMIKTATRMKAAGVKSGVPDICLPVPGGGYHGLYIELKSFKKGAGTSDLQKEWIEYLNEAGYKALVCQGWRNAKDEIIKYLEGEA